MKRIAIEKVKCFDGYAFRIVEQTHRGNEFGQGGNNCFHGSKRKLISKNYSEVFYQKDVYVWGTDTLKDRQILIATIEEMRDIELTFKEYNEYFSDSFKMGVSVWDAVKGEGLIVSINSGNAEYPVEVRFTDKNWYYTSEGKFFNSDILPSLYKYPVKIVKVDEK